MINKEGVIGLLAIILIVSVFIGSQPELTDETQLDRVEEKVDKLIELGEKWNDRIMYVEDIAP